MTMEQDTYTAPSTRQRSNDCEPLFEAAHLSIYRENTFRITGLSIDASEREIKKQAAKLKMLEELGQGGDAATHPYGLRPTPSVDQIRAAMQRLKEPEHRLIDEFFWFWPEEFGKSDQDAALQALQRGDATAAHELWSNAAVDPRTGYVAIHNLAVLYHLVALDWTLEDLTATVDPEREAKIEQYWRTAFHYWEQLATHDDIWDVLKARVQALDDARLTTGFVRRMRTSLPEAFDKINAEAALRFAEADRMDWAQKHIDFMNETHQGLDDVQKTSMLVLAPARKRVQQLVQLAKEETSKNPAQGKQAAESLVNTCGSIKHLFELFQDHVAQHNDEVFDQVAEQINSALVTHGRHTGENTQYIDLLESALMFAREPSLRELITKNISIRKANASYEQHKPLFEQLAGIRDHHTPVSGYYDMVRTQILPLIDQVDEDSKVGVDLRDLCAQVLREISVTAHNQDRDFDTSLGAIQLAIAIAKSDDLLADLQKDRATLSSNHQGLVGSFVDIKMRGDRVVITDKEFVFNSTRISNSHATGLRFGVAASYTNGIRTYLSYFIGIRSPSAEVKIECKKMLGSEAQAKADYTAIVNGVFTHTAPKIIANLVKLMTSGQTVNLGSYRMGRDGVFLKSGMLMWAKEHLVPWDKVGHSMSQGDVLLVARGDSKIRGSMTCRDDWNAVLFEPLAKAMTTALRNKR